jgi:AcrR family transcriptional regulator
VEGAFQLSNRAGTGIRADAVRNRQLALDAAMALLSGPDTALTVEAIANKAGLGAATVVRAFGGKDALVDAAVSRLLGPVVQRARDLLSQTTPYQALRAFLPELIAFQSAHLAVGDQLGGLNLPATTALRAGLVATVEEMVDGARRDGAIRSDIDPAVLRTLIERTALAVARAQPLSQELADAYLTVLLDGLRPAPLSGETRLVGEDYQLGAVAGA